MSSLRVLSPAQAVRAGRLWKPWLSALAKAPQSLSSSSPRITLPEMWVSPSWMAAHPVPYFPPRTGSEWPGGTLPLLLLQLHFFAQFRWVKFRAAARWQTDAKQIADTYLTLQICSFSLILIPTHKHFSYIHWLHYHCRSVINKLKGRIVIQFNLGKIFK